MPEAPEHLPAAERSLWASLARQVDALGVFTAADLTSFRLMVGAVRLTDEAARDDSVSVNQKVAARTAALNALAQFGLTPQARTRVKKVAPAEQGDDPASEFVQ